MRKRFLILIAIGVCALAPPVTHAQVVNANQSSPSESATSRETGLAEIRDPVSPAALLTKLNEAKQLLKSKADVSSGKIVALAVLDSQTDELRLLTIQKDLFLTKAAVIPVIARGGGSLHLTIVRANGVNTAVRVTDDSTGDELQPLMVAFPIEKNGAVTEVAYYSSAHPAILSPNVFDAGETYVDTMLDRAAEDLAAKGVQIPSEIVDVAEHLCVVEHTDHKRFMTEDHSSLLPEVVSLYGLNEGDTFRYSVSTAGAGGMIQMIPRTYEAIRQQHSTVPLQSDFVTGMRDHRNALEAMLLYMNDTWTNLAESSEVQDALRNGIATKPELLAAGYNSNPRKLPTYLKNGGSNWRTLIPAETQMYLTIYGEVDRTIKFSDAKGPQVDAQNLLESTRTRAPEGFLSWLHAALIDGRSMFTRLL